MSVGLANTEIRIHLLSLKGSGGSLPPVCACSLPGSCVPFIGAVLETDINVICLYRGLPALFAAGP